MFSQLTISEPAPDISRLNSKPELTVVHDLNDYPANARCSSCGKQMPVRQRWIMSSAENLDWFADQFRLHVALEHQVKGAHTDLR